jgi:hypothetical protein
MVVAAGVLIVLLISVCQGLQLIAKLSLVLLTLVLPALFLALIDPLLDCDWLVKLPGD